MEEEQRYTVERISLLYINGRLSDGSMRPGALYTQRRRRPVGGFSKH